MALTLIKEDGTGKVDANSYADAVDGDAYHDGHLYATAWAGASSGNKEKALVMATRLIDALCRFNGVRGVATQALQWPRAGCPDPDRPGGLLGVGSWQMGVGYGAWVPTNEVPKPVVDATCEMARELLLQERSAAPPGEGMH